ncbi:MAG TPA: hypothetical protein V6D27_13730 [Vampirovibrionales bacterium]
MEKSIEINPLPPSHRQGLGGKKDPGEEPPSGGMGRNLGSGMETAIAWYSWDWGPNIYLEDGDRVVPFAQRLKLYHQQKDAHDTHEGKIKSAKPRATSTPEPRFRRL